MLNSRKEKYKVDKDGFVWTLKGIKEYVPFQLPSILSNPDKEIIVVGGEKDAKNLALLGFIATTNVAGEGNFQTDLIKYFSGRHVIIIPDCDQAGEKRLIDVSKKLVSVADSIRYVELPYRSGSKKDISDYIEEQKESAKSDDEIISNINALISGAKVVDKRFISTTTTENKKNLAKEIIFKAGSHKLVSEFSHEVLKTLAKEFCLFRYYNDVCRIEEIKRKDTYGKEKSFTGLNQISPTTFITFVEGFIIPMKENSNGEYYSSLNHSEARQILQSEQISLLPSIKGFTKTSLPYIAEGKLKFTPKGYDPSTNYFTDNFTDDLKIYDIGEARDTLGKLFHEFCFLEYKLDLSRAIAYLLTPMLKLLSNETRSMIFLAEGNRPGVGKDLLLGLPIIIYDDQTPYYYSPFNSDDECRKTLFSACRNGERFVIFSNAKGVMNYKALEHYSTSNRVKDRILGSTDTKEYPNNTILAFSSNGLEITEDLSRRVLDIRLEYYEEDIQRRKFSNIDLNYFCFHNRAKILNSLYSLVNYWHTNGAKLGTSIGSFQQWSQIVAGVLTTAGYEDPFQKRSVISEAMKQSGDPITTDMAILFKEIHYKYQTTELLSNEILDMCNEFELFQNITHTGKGAPKKMTSLLKQFSNRILGNYQLKINSATKYNKYFILKV